MNPVIVTTMKYKSKHLTWSQDVKTFLLSTKHEQKIIFRNIPDSADKSPFQGVIIFFEIFFPNKK